MAHICPYPNFVKLAQFHHFSNWQHMNFASSLKKWKCEGIPSWLKEMDQPLSEMRTPLWFQPGPWTIAQKKAIGQEMPQPWLCNAAKSDLHTQNPESRNPLLLGIFSCLRWTEILFLCMAQRGFEANWNKALIWCRGEVYSFMYCTEMPVFLQQRGRSKGKSHDTIQPWNTARVRVWPDSQELYRETAQPSLSTDIMARTLLMLGQCMCFQCPAL